MSDLLSLISRLEAAKEGARELDAKIEISRRRFLFGAAAVAGMSIQPGGWIVGGDSPNPIKAPAYTSSVDAALSLVPEGWSFYRLDQYSNGPDPIWGWGAQLRCHANPEVGLAIGETRASMPLALCIASLRARATT
jgi:hypothetical protein